MIKFLKERKILDEKDEVRLHYKAGQKVSDLPHDAEFAHVRRGFAAFVGDDGKLYDHDGNPVADGRPKRIRPSRAGSRTPRVPRAKRVRSSGKKASGK